MSDRVKKDKQVNRWGHGHRRRQQVLLQGPIWRRRPL